MIFSKRLVFVYTLIIVIPLLVLSIIVTNRITSDMYEELENNCVRIVGDAAEKVNSNIDSFALVESAVSANADFLYFLQNPEMQNEDEIITIIRDEVNSLLRVLFVLPDIYAVRIFVNNPTIPERWPLVLLSSRTDLASLNKWEYNYSADYMGNFTQYMDLSLCTTRPLNRNKRNLGYLQISMRMDKYFPYLYKSESKYDGSYAFSIKEGELVPIQNKDINSFQKKLSPNEVKQLTQAVVLQNDANLESQSDTGYAQSGVILLKDAGDSKICAWQTINRMDLVLVHTCSTQIRLKNLWLFRLGVLLVLVLTSFMLFFLIRLITLKLMSRVYSIMDGMRQVRNGNLDASVEIDGNDEVTETQKSFNAMTSQLRSQIEQIKVEQSLVSDTEIKAMQNQINAHFLYNVLETIKMQAVIAEQDDIAESLTVLGKMMRYCLRWRIHRVPVSQEIDYICSYIYILNLRNDYTISLKTEIEECYLSVEIPKMVLQPLIENAFTYAIEPLGKDATIEVYTKCDKKNGKLYLCVQDFGCGISSEKLEEIRKYLLDNTYERDVKGSIGLKNIQQRLEMFYGNDYRIIIESSQEKGTLICVPVPLVTDTLGEKQ